MMDLHGEKCYNGTNCITNAPAQLPTAGGVSHRSDPMTTPIVVSPADSDNLKRCPKCGETKPRGMFYRSASNADGLHALCKACDKAYSAERYTKNRERNAVVTYTPGEVKRCPKCKTVKPTTEFSLDRVKTDGLSTNCKSCQSAHHAAKGYASQKRYREQNREKVLKRARDRARERYADNPEFYREKTRQWRKENPDKVVESRRKRQSSGKALSAKRVYYMSERGKETMRVTKQNRRARERAAAATLTREDINAIRISQTDSKGRLICWYCGKPIKGAPDLDHWIPLDKGGPTIAGNLHYMHASCNRSKATKHPTELGRLL